MHPMGVREHVLEVGEQGLPFLPVITLKAKFDGRGVITCERAYEVDVHWIGRRTLPCLDGECQACLKQVPKKYEGYLSVVWMHNRKHEIVRMTRDAMLIFKSQLCSTDSLRGHVLHLVRKGVKSNGRVIPSVEPLEIETARLPKSPDLRAHLAKIWRVDGIEVDHDERAYVAQISEFVDRKLLENQQYHAEEEKKRADNGRATG